MYLGKRSIYSKAEYEERRKKCIEYKPDATATAFSELEDIINKSQLAKQYFGRSQSWFSQRLNGCWVLNKSMSFKEEEYHQLAEAFRDIAKRLQAHADEIDSAAFEDSSELSKHKDRIEKPQGSQNQNTQNKKTDGNR